MLLWCPICGARHIDKGDFAVKPHHTHACQECGTVWRPAIVNTLGVQFLPGFRDKQAKGTDVLERLRDRIVDDGARIFEGDQNALQAINTCAAMVESEMQNTGNR